MPNLRLNEAEQTALSGMDYPAICLYIMAIRPRMDFRTGVAGLCPRISWQALREWLYVEPRPGVKATIPSIDAIRRMAQQLVKHGLLRIDSRDKQLIFSCLLADTDRLVQKKAASKPPAQANSEAATSEASNDAGFDENAARRAAGGGIQEAATHPGTGKPKTPPPPSPPPRVEGKLIESAMPVCSGGDHDFHFSGRPIATGFSAHRQRAIDLMGDGASRRPAEEGEQVRREEDLAWPSSIAQHRRADIAKKLAPLGVGMSQVVLDEWRGRMEVAANGAHPILHPYKLLSSIVSDAAEPGWLPDHADRIRAEREARMRHDAVIATATRFDQVERGRPKRDPVDLIKDVKNLVKPGVLARKGVRV